MATTPTDLVNDYINSRISVPMPKNTQQEGERYNAENEDGNNDEYRKRREYEEEPVPTREEYEANQREAEREIEYNSQRELDDLDQSEPDYNDAGNRLEDTKFSGNYFEKPDENEPNESLGDRIRARYDSLRASASDTAESLSSTFGASFGAAAGAASRFRRGDPIFSVQSPVRRAKNPYARRPSRQNRNLSRPYVGGRFGDFTLGASTENQYYPTNTGQKSRNDTPAMDVYLPSGGAAYEGEFSGRNAFKRSEFSNERERYDPFGFGIGGRLSADGFDNMRGEFGESLLGGVGNSQESSIFGGMSAGTDTVFGDGAMFNAPRGKAKREVNGFGLDIIIGDSGGMFTTTDPSPRKTTTKRKSTSSRTTKKASKAKPTRRKQATRKQSSSGFVLP